jgi:hypothetical protein
MWLSLIPLPWKLFAGGLLAAGVFAGGFAAGYKVRHTIDLAERADFVEAQRQALEAVADEISRIDIENKTIHAKVVEKVIERPVYRDCRHEPDALRLLNNAINGQRSSDQADVPKNAADAQRSEFWGDIIAARRHSWPVPQMPLGGLGYLGGAVR